jgi:hypothetical protein
VRIDASGSSLDGYSAHHPFYPPCACCSNKVLEVVKSVVEGANTVPEIINREMKTERVEELREAKMEVTSGME